MLRNFCLIILLSLLGALKVQANCTTGVPPAAPVIDSVSVLPNGDIEICWLDPFPVDPDLAGFNVWTIDGTGANELLTPVFIPVGTNCYTYLAADNNAGSQSVQILIEAFDNCPPPGPYSSGVSAGGFVSTIYLQEAFIPCTKSVKLNWTAYNGFPNSSVRYDINVSVNAAPYTRITSSFSLDYEYLGVVPGNTYDFYVTAVENGGVGPFRSSSNIVNSDVTAALIFPTFNDLNWATVIDSQQIDIQFRIDLLADMTAYKIQRSTSESGPFVTISTVAKVPGMAPEVNYSDVGVNTNLSPYFYQIEIVNEICGFDSMYSNLASTILVDVTSSPIDALNTVTMTEYIDWDVGVLQYDIYRAVGGVWETLPLRSFPAFSDTMTFVDDVSEVFGGNGEFCYKVEAISKGVDNGFSMSNEACALHEPLIYMPNAFFPGGIYNPVFKPILTFANPNTYSFKVFNRWGVVVFETGDVSEAWNGRFDNSGELSPTGVYFYVVKFHSAQGDLYTKRGNVTIVN